MGVIMIEGAIMIKIDRGGEYDKMRMIMIDGVIMIMIDHDSDHDDAMTMTTLL